MVAGLNPLTFIPPVGDGISIEQTFEMQLENARMESGLSITEFNDIPGSHIWLGKKWHLCLSDILIAYQMRKGQEGIINTMQMQKIRSKK